MTVKLPNWDEKYAAGGGALYGTAPNEYLRAIVARPDFQARSALVLADGDGRNGRWLAGRGLAVTAVDLSPVATAQASAADAATGVAVERIAADLTTWTPPDGRLWDTAVISFLQTVADLRAQVIATAIAALAPGGWLVIEAFERDGAGPDAPVGPPEPEVRYTLDEILVATADLTLIEAMTGLVRLDQGRKHQGVGALVRYAGRRPQ